MKNKQMAEFNVIDIINTYREKLPEYRKFGVEHIVKHGAMKTAHETIKKMIESVQKYPDVEDSDDYNYGIGILSQLVYSNTVDFNFDFDALSLLFYRGLPIFSKEEIDCIYRLKDYGYDVDSRSEYDVLGDDLLTEGDVLGIKYQITSLKLYYSQWSKTYKLNVAFTVDDTFELDPVEEPTDNLTDEDVIDLDFFI